MHVAVEVAAPAWPHAGLSRQVEDDSRAVEDAPQVGVDQVCLFEDEVAMRAHATQVLLLAQAGVVVAEGVDARYLMAVSQSSLARVRAAEPGGAGYSYSCVCVQHASS